MKKILIFAIVLAGMATEVLAVTDLAAWESDLKLYESRLPSRHPLLFFKVKHSVFRENLSRLKSSLPKLTDGQAYLELQRVTAAMSDDHTAVASTEIMRNMEQYPLAIRVFGNELYILAIAEENKQALGAKIISIGGVPIAAALSKVAPYISTASRVTVKTKLPNIFSFVDLWRLVGLAQADGSIEINCQAGDKEPFALVLSPQTPTTMAERKNKIARLKTVTCPTSYRSNQFYFTLKLDEGSTLYVQYNKCWGKDDGGELLKNWPHPESVPSHDDFFDEIRRELVTGKITKFIFDLRSNGGGHDKLGYMLAHNIAADPVLNRKDHLFVLIGSRTFSAAMNIANEFRNRTHATLIGEPTSGTSAHLGAVDFFTLPKTKIMVTHSTKYIDSGGEDDKGGNVKPDILAEPTIEDYINGTDPAVEAALQFKEVTQSRADTLKNRADTR